MPRFEWNYMMNACGDYKDDFWLDQYGLMIFRHRLNQVMFAKRSYH